MQATLPLELLPSRPPPVRCSRHWNSTITPGNRVTLSGPASFSSRIQGRTRPDGRLSQPG